ncbi:hypothetical protein [Pseudoteredinibacter isoporae]|uniref:Ca2+-binding EF-hand superfamily protein n=1 Tax=Pseudoteredinibacter isoporae TaxID=570281 RepID=A0A7X0MZW0_9GAMM|nr:hypothetical protein [Pseudoteredinibacter isoporae]MBB6523592.1 Ca2+-binding EF-hand superfamily protein [Pseudoteredinibacter isoporae]NHO89100.1 hypothetical protein [Pseudoteredinibacter isoporae]NIB22289.1 hypothetical protein [Pseudoteredinibacter isoporae]
MKKLLPIAIAVASLSACSQTTPVAEQSSANNAKAAMADSKGLSKTERAKAAKDDRGHRPMPMTEERLARILEDHDASKDSVVSWGEYNDSRRKFFDSVDSNKNGTLDTEEYVYEYEGRLDDRIEKDRKGQVKQTIVRFKALDKDDNEVMTWAEYEASGERTFARWDGNKDNVIDENDPKPEYKWKKKKGEKVAKADKKKAKKKARRRSMIRMPTTHSKKGMFTIYDANEDGKITKDEFVNERRSVFHLADQDKSGDLVLNEYLGEYEDRVDAAIAKTRRAAIKQTYIRFDVLDDNKDKSMTFDELQISGKRIFNRWDKNQDGVISADDIAASQKVAAKSDSY